MTLEITDINRLLSGGGENLVIRQDGEDGEIVERRVYKLPYELPVGRVQIAIEGYGRRAKAENVTVEEKNNGASCSTHGWIPPKISKEIQLETPMGVRGPIVITVLSG
jgi:hypothetical protein